MVLVAKLALGAAALVAVWFIIRGLMDMQAIDTADKDVVELQGVVRRVAPHGRFDQMAVLTITANDEVRHVDCLLPGPWVGKRRHRVTDLVRVLWKKGSARAVALETLRNGQRMFLIGFISLALAALMYVLLF